MRVLLLYPDTPETFWSFKHALRFVSKKARLMGTPLAAICSAMELMGV